MGRGTDSLEEVPAERLLTPQTERLRGKNLKMKEMTQANKSDMSSQPLSRHFGQIKDWKQASSLFESKYCANKEPCIQKANVTLYLSGTSLPLTFLFYYEWRLNILTRTQFVFLSNQDATATLLSFFFLLHLKLFNLWLLLFSCPVLLKTAGKEIEKSYKKFDSYAYCESCQACKFHPMIYSWKWPL